MNTYSQSSWGAMDGIQDHGVFVLPEESPLLTVVSATIAFGFLFVLANGFVLEYRRGLCRSRLCLFAKGSPLLATYPLPSKSGVRVESGARRCFAKLKGNVDWY